MTRRKRLLAVFLGLAAASGAGAVFLSRSDAGRDLLDAVRVDSLAREATGLGIPTSLAEIQDVVEYGEGLNGAPALLDVAGDMAEPSKGRALLGLDLIWERRELREIRARLPLLLAALSSAEDAARADYLRWNRDWQKGVFEAIPDVSLSKSAGFALLCRSEHLCAEGRFEESWQDVERVNRLAAMMREDPSWSYRTLADSLEAGSLTQALRIVHASKQDERWMDRLAKLARTENRGSFRRVLLVDAFLSIHTIRSYSLLGGEAAFGQNSGPAAGVLGRMQVSGVPQDLASRSKMAKVLRFWLEVFLEPEVTEEAVLTRLAEAGAGTFPQASQAMLLRQILGDRSFVLSSYMKVKYMREAVLAALDVIRWRKKRGAYPKILGEALISADSAKVDSRMSFTSDKFRFEISARSIPGATRPGEVYPFSLVSYPPLPGG